MNWFVRPDNLLYAKYDTGYKSGGFNNNGNGPSIPYGSEILKTEEIGSKNDFLDRHLEFNIDALHSDYSGYQASQITGVLVGGGIFNVGSATIRGV